MKALRKNIYAFGVITLFIIAAAMLILFLTLFSSSTAVDGTTVGSVWIGDKKPNTDARKQKLLKGINDWQTKKATYTFTEPFRINLPDQIGMDRIYRNRPGPIIAFHHVPPS